MKPSIKPSLKSAATKTSERMETGNPMVEFPMGRMLGGGGLPVQKAFWCLLERLAHWQPHFMVHEKKKGWGAPFFTKQSSVSYQDLKDQQTEPPCTHLGVCGHTIQTQSGRGAGRKSTVAHASQRMVTVCSLPLQEPVKYVLSTKQPLRASSLTAWIRTQTYPKGSVRQKRFNKSFMESWLCSKQTGQSSCSNKRNLPPWPAGQSRQQQVNRSAAKVNKEDMKRGAQIKSGANIWCFRGIG